MNVAFWESESTIGSTVPFQLSVGCPDMDIGNLRFESITFGFSDERPDLVITHDDSGDESDVSRVDVGQLPSSSSHSAKLAFARGKRLLVCGTLGGRGSDVTVSQ